MMEMVEYADRILRNHLGQIESELYERVSRILDRYKTEMKEVAKYELNLDL